MAELLGLVASVIQVAGAGLQLSKTLYDYVDGVTTADRRIKDIASEIKMTSIVIEELGDVFKHEETASLVSRKAIKTANDTITECSALFAQIDATLKKSKKNTFGRLALPFRDTKLELLRSHVDKLKSTLQLLMQVLTHAYQVASRKLDRAAEERQREEIKQLLEKKDQSTKKHENLLRKDSASTDSTLVDDDELGKEVGQIVAPDPVMAASTINSTITAQSLATCVNHVRNLLGHIEILQEALAATAPGDDHSRHHQNLVDSYFRTRGHLDQVVLGSSKHKLSPLTADPGGMGNKIHTANSGQLEKKKKTTKESKEKELLARAQPLNVRSAPKRESHASSEDRAYTRTENVVNPKRRASGGPLREQSVARASGGDSKVIEREEHRRRRRDEQRHLQAPVDREVAANLTQEENERFHLQTPRAQTRAEQRADEMIAKRADERERLRHQEKQERESQAARVAAIRDVAARREKPINTIKPPAPSWANSVHMSSAEVATWQQPFDAEVLRTQDERRMVEAMGIEKHIPAYRQRRQDPAYRSPRASRVTMVGGPLNDRHNPELPPEGPKIRSRLSEPGVAKSYSTREYMPSSQKREVDSAVDELLKEWTTILG